MRLHRHSAAAIGACVLSLTVSAATGPGTAGDAVADRVMGQISFQNAGRNFVEARGLDAPAGVAIDRSVTPHRLYVADAGNNRVLVWHNANTWTSGQPADAVIGQPDFHSSRCSTFCDPVSVAVDPAGNLYVADRFYDRVLEFNKPFAGGDDKADRVFGGPCGLNPPSRSNICDPVAVAVDSAGNLYVADGYASRIMVYRNPIANDTTADLVLGQPSFTSNSCNFETLSMCWPTGVAVDEAGNVFVATRIRAKILRFDNPLGTGDTVADWERDTDILDSIAVHDGAIYTGTWLNQIVVYYDRRDTPLIGETWSEMTLISSAAQMAVDDDGTLYAAAEGSNCIHAFDSPIETDGVVDRTLGQPGSAPNWLDDIGMDVPTSVAIDRSVTPNRVVVADSGNYRLLVWDDTTSWQDGDPADRVLDISASDLVVDRQGNLYAASGHRVLAYRTPLAPGGDITPDLVFGQNRDTGSNICNLNGISRDSLCGATSIAVDGIGNLYVADVLNNRVLEYDRPLATNDTRADRVFGQPGFTTGSACENSYPYSPTVTDHTFCHPSAVAVDSVGNLYVADAWASRVLVFDSPTGAGDAVADAVFGQDGDFTKGKCRGPSRNALCEPFDIAVDPNDNLYVFDSSFRILGYVSPRAGGDTLPDWLYGTTSFGSFYHPGVSSTGVSDSSDMAFDDAGNLYIADAYYNRLLEVWTPQFENLPPAAGGGGGGMPLDGLLLGGLLALRRHLRK